jgi:hypothetical protein
MLNGQIKLFVELKKRCYVLRLYLLDRKVSRQQKKVLRIQYVSLLRKQNNSETS